jgi:large subunit ribosomal protein L24
MAAKIKKGDKVIVLAGKDRGAEGEVVRVMPQDDRLIVRSVNLIKKHQRQTQTDQGGIISREASIHISNVALKDPSTGKATRVGFKVEDGKKVRIAKLSGEVIDG